MLCPSYHSIYPIRLPRLQPPQDDLLQAFFGTLDALTQQQVFTLQNGDILCLSAKVLAIHQGRCCKLDSPAERRELLQQEADYYLANSLNPIPPIFGDHPESESIDFPFTVKGKTPVPFAGIDESNGDGWHILWPEEPQKITEELKRLIAAHCKLNSLGLIVLDSTVFPMRRGCVSLSIAATGIQLLHGYQGQKDLFGRELKLSENNVVDRIANFAGLYMGEGAEQTPLVVLRGLERFVTGSQSFSELFIEAERDFYGPLFPKGR